MNVEKRYNAIKEKLERGHRYLVPLSSEEIEWLADNLLKATDSELNKLLCIVENTSTQAKELADPLIKLLAQKNLTAENIIFALNAARRHIILRQQKLGQRLEMPVLKVLSDLLKHPKPEVVEWTLRTIDEVGSQAIFFREEWRKIKPNYFSTLFNQHNKAISQIIGMFENRWKI